MTLKTKNNPITFPPCVVYPHDFLCVIHLETPMGPMTLINQQIKHNFCSFHDATLPNKAQFISFNQGKNNIDRTSS